MSPDETDPATDRRTDEKVPVDTSEDPEARARRGRSAELRATLCFAAAVVASLVLAVVYITGGQTQLEGILLGVATGGIGAGIVIWAKAYMPPGEVTEERGILASSEEEIAAFAADFEAGEQSLVRRKLLLGTGAAALGAFALALLFPLRSLGPRPGAGLKRTAFADGPVRLVRVRTERPEPVPEGEEPEAPEHVEEPIRPEDVPVDGVLTVWPEGHSDDADAPTLLIRTRRNRDFDVRDGREGWTVEGLVAYSKLCTHTGCPVGLYQAEEGLLLCPCHQSTFDVYDGARPIFGPAARSLPQLPLDVDDDGYLIAEGDFSDPVGSGFWDRGRD